MSVISCANKESPEALALETNVTGAVPISTIEVGAAVSAFPVPSRAVPVYPILVAGIVLVAVVSAELCIVIVNELPTRSDTVNLWSPDDDAAALDIFEEYDQISILDDAFGPCQR